MTSLDGFYPEMSDYHRHEDACLGCGAPLELYPVVEQSPVLCEECQEQEGDADASR
jgi:formamidopyrimidine-DNA glycosylase